MAIVLEDLLNKVKVPAPAVDLFHTKVSNRRDFDLAFEKVPEYRIRPEKVFYLFIIIHYLLYLN